MAGMSYQKVDELVEKRIKPVMDGIDNLSIGQKNVIEQLTEINGSVRDHSKEIEKARKDLDKEIQAGIDCPVRSGIVDVVIVERETRWSRWIARNRSFILIIVLLIALLSGFPNWMRFFGVEAPWIDREPPTVIVYPEYPDLP